MTQNFVSAGDDNSVLRHAFRIHKEYGEPVRRILDETKLLDHFCKPFADDLYLYLPLLHYPEKEERLAILNFLEPILKQLPKPNGGAEFLGLYVKDTPFKTQKKVPTVSDLLGFTAAYEIIGDIAVLDDKIVDNHDKENDFNENSFNENSCNESSCNQNDTVISKIAGAILTAHPSVKTVLLSKGPI